MPSSSTRPGRFGQRCAEAAKPEVMLMFSRAMAAAMRRYLSGRIAVMIPARRMVVTRPAVSVTRSSGPVSRSSGFTGAQPITGKRRSSASSSSARCITRRTCASTSSMSGFSPNSAAMSIGSSVCHHDLGSATAR